MVPFVLISLNSILLESILGHEEFVINEAEINFVLILRCDYRLLES